MLTRKQKTINWIIAAIMIVMSLFFLFPVIWMIANSFKPDAAITKDMNSIAAFIPPALNGSFFDNYVSILTNTSFIHYMLNTLFYAAILIILGIIVNGLAGYALAKINFPFKERWLLIIMLLMIVPMETIITIHFLFIAKLGLLNTVIGYVLPMIVNPFNIFLFRQVFISLPDDGRGYAMDHEEQEMGLTCIGAPILDRNKKAVAAISLSGPTSRMNSSDLEDRIEAVCNTARDISGNF